MIKPSNEMCLLGSNTHQNTYSPLVDGLPSLAREWAENHLLTLTSFKRNLLLSTSSWNKIQQNNDKMASAAK